MAAYDPKRTRPSREGEEEAPAQVDALLYPAPADPAVTEAPSSGAPTSEPDPAPEAEPTVDLRDSGATVAAEGAPRPVPPVLSAPAPDQTTQRVAVVAGLAAATLAALMIWRRRRRG